MWKRHWKRLTTLLGLARAGLELGLGPIPGSKINIRQDLAIGLQTTVFAA
jgi:hypothetical protein